MKHWIEFLPKKTYKTKRIGKIINSYDFEILEAEEKIKMYKNRKADLECEIYEQLKPFFSSFEVLQGEVIKAKENAEKWNAEPTADHKPHGTK